MQVRAQDKRASNHIAKQHIDWQPRVAKHALPTAGQLMFLVTDHWSTLSSLSTFVVHGHCDMPLVLVCALMLLAPMIRPL